MLILFQFLLRVSFGMSAAMATVSPKQVTSGYFRNHLYVILGMNVLAILVAMTHRSEFLLWPPIAGAALSYLGSALWLYEKPRAGRIFLVALAMVSLLGLWSGGNQLLLVSNTMSYPAHGILHLLDPFSGGLALGVTLAAMFLGHWYLNTPTMKLVPLQRLVLGMGGVILLRAAICGAGLALTLTHAPPHTLSIWFVLLRWLAGIFGVLGVVWMTWETLKIPNTQSATGILYVGVILVFIGELASLLMSSGAPYPL